MDLQQLSLSDHLLIDEFLFYLADKQTNQEYLRFWESAALGVVLGRIGKLEAEVNITLAKQDSMPVYRRCSGGGTVLQGPGSFNFSLILAKERDPALNDVRKSYQWILQQMIDLLATLGIAATFKPICDLALVENDRKFSGNAQRRGKHFILHHGTILYAMDLNLIAKYLQQPVDQPDYRDDRSHLDFVTTINITPQELTDRFSQLFQLTPKTVLSEEELSLFTEWKRGRDPQILF